MNLGVSSFVSLACRLVPLVGAETQLILIAEMCTMGGSAFADTVDCLGIDPLTSTGNLCGVVPELLSRVNIYLGASAGHVWSSGYY
jgi:hypothetical protein